MIKPKKLISCILLGTFLLNISLNAGFWNSVGYTAGKGVTVNPTQILHLLKGSKAKGLTCYTKAIAANHGSFLAMVEAGKKDPRKIDALISFFEEKAPHKTEGFKSWAKFAGKSLKYELANYVSWCIQFIKYLDLIKDDASLTFEDGYLSTFLNNMINALEKVNWLDTALIVLWPILFPYGIVFPLENDRANPDLKEKIQTYTTKAMLETVVGVGSSMLFLKQLDSCNAKNLAAFLVENYNRLKEILEIQNSDTRKSAIEGLLKDYYKEKLTPKAIYEDKGLRKIIGIKTIINCLGYLASSPVYLEKA